MSEQTQAPGAPAALASPPLPIPSAALLNCLLQALDLHGDGLAVVDALGTLVYANPIARHSLATHGWLDNDSQQLKCPHRQRREPWLKALKAALGCGGSIEGDALMLQGDHRERLSKLLASRGVKKVIVA